MKKIKLIAYLFSVVVGTQLILMGCSNNEVNISQVTPNHEGYLVNISNDVIEYRCGDKVAVIEDGEKFSCPSFPITFYIDSLALGEINSIHGDGYVFPQDIISVDNSNIIDKSINHIKVALR
ncbi:MAG: hypothetical protein KU29_02930 [Sulfurovum sp. FS06-10]|jgi:hypothetical protein|nr:MAG: hypothetical protein KU29_02930 [Sulfurovum sp. FS06-10]